MALFPTDNTHCDQSRQQTQHPAFPSLCHIVSSYCVVLPQRTILLSTRSCHVHALSSFSHVLYSITQTPPSFGQLPYFVVEKASISFLKKCIFIYLGWVCVCSNLGVAQAFAPRGSYVVLGMYPGSSTRIGCMQGMLYTGCTISATQEQTFPNALPAVAFGEELQGQSLN